MPTTLFQVYDDPNACFEVLLLQPLLRLQERGHAPPDGILIVIDGLDETVGSSVSGAAGGGAGWAEVAVARRASVVATAEPTPTLQGSGGSGALARAAARTSADGDGVPVVLSSVTLREAERYGLDEALLILVREQFPRLPACVQLVFGSRPHKRVVQALSARWVCVDMRV